MDNQVLNFWKQTWLKDVQFIQTDWLNTEVFDLIRKKRKFISLHVWPVENTVTGSTLPPVKQKSKKISEKITNISYWIGSKKDLGSQPIYQ